MISDGNNSNVLFPADLDADGDIDIAFTNGLDLFWYRNEDGSATFSSPQMIEPYNGFTLFEGANASDLDGDGDMDVIAIVDASDFGLRIIEWYENTDGLGNFSSSSKTVLFRFK